MTSDSEHIEACVRTPQFKDDKIFGFVTQRGVLNIKTWVFEPTHLVDDGGTGVGMHKVHFHDKENYLKAKV